MHRAARWETRVKFHDDGTGRRHRMGVTRAMLPADSLKWAHGGTRAEKPRERDRSDIMNVEVTDRFEIPKEMRSMAEASFEQARKAFENFVSNAQQTAAKIEGQGATVR